ncbi:MAG: type II toxin-antitoxin system RelE/ParE family toxin [Cyanobacteria bacterium J06638_28]
MRAIQESANLTCSPRPDGVVKIKGSDNEYRIRIGDYRVRYEINDKALVILLL